MSAGISRRKLLASSAAVGVSMTAGSRAARAQEVTLRIVLAKRNDRGLAGARRNPRPSQGRRFRMR